jgi:hypothetical protein
LIHGITVDLEFLPADKKMLELPKKIGRKIDPHLNKMDINRARTSLADGLRER